MSISSIFNFDPKKLYAGSYPMEKKDLIKQTEHAQAISSSLRKTSFLQPRNATVKKGKNLSQTTARSPKYTAMTGIKLLSCAALVTSVACIVYQSGCVHRFVNLSKDSDGCICPRPANQDTDLSSVDKDVSINTPPFILSNEIHRAITREVLGKTQATNNGLHIGFSCWANYDIIAVRKSSYAVLADRSNLVNSFLETTKNTILASKNRMQFVDKITGFLKQNPVFLRPENPIQVIKNELFREGGWLSNDASFTRIQSLYQNKRIFHIRMDITDCCAFSQLASWMKQNHLYCDSLDISNIPDWLTQRQIDLLGRAIKKIFSPGTYIIHASLQFSKKSQIEQRVFPYSGPFDVLCVLSGKC